MSDKKATASKAAGWTQLCDPDLGTIECDTIQCCHCGTHHEVRPGSGKLRGFCTRCNGFTCGPTCAECVPMEKWLDCVEKGIDPTTVTTVCGGWSPPEGGKIHLPTG